MTDLQVLYLALDYIEAVLETVPIDQLPVQLTKINQYMNRADVVSAMVRAGDSLQADIVADYRTDE